MSRIGKKIINIPDGVEVKIDNDQILVKGKGGQLSQKIHPQVKIANKDNQLEITISKPDDANQNALWGLFGSLVNNMIIGVTTGYKKQLEVNGVGYKVNLQGNKLVLNVGFSHQIQYQVPEGINVTVENNVITLLGIDKQQLGEVAAQIRRIKKPEPYKGKGIKYIDEVIKKKVGKAAAKSSGK